MPNKTNCKRVLAFALALLMLVTMLPTAVLAEELLFNVATSTDIAPFSTEMNLSETIAAEGFAYVQPVRPAKVYNMPDLPEDGHLYTLTDTHAVLLATGIPAAVSRFGSAWVQMQPCAAMWMQTTCSTPVFPQIRWPA